MSSKILNAVLGLTFIILSSINSAQAGLIVGDLYADDSGVMWEYVGSYDLTDIDLVNNSIPPMAINGLEAAELIFGVLSSGEYALSAGELGAELFGTPNNSIDLIAGSSGFYVNHDAWYDAFQGDYDIHAEDVVADNQGGVGYDAIGDISALVDDRAVSGFNINYVFSSVSIPEPSTLLIFSLGVFGLLARKKSNSL